MVKESKIIRLYSKSFRIGGRKPNKIYYTIRTKVRFFEILSFAFFLSHHFFQGLRKHFHFVNSPCTDATPIV